MACVWRSHHWSDNECNSPAIEVSVALSNLGTGQLAVSRDLGSVFSVVVFDLEPKEVMNCFQRVGICGLNTHSATCRQLFKAVRNLSTFFFHHRYAGQYLIVDEHRDGEFSVGEHRDNVGQVGPDSCQRSSEHIAKSVLT